MLLKTFKITINGQVQGVGFRPHVYTLAKQFGLKGTVFNNENGVIILAQASVNKVNTFYETLIERPPTVSKIDGYHMEEVDFMPFEDFQIIPSKATDKLNLQLTPDFAICNNCRDDIRDGHNRRYLYPFTTCVNCGPRWAITRTFPFERHNTSMNDFKMCKACEEDYSNPEERRFHSQTNSCAACGIDLYLVDNSGNELISAKHDLFRKVRELLIKGAIVAMKNTSGYLLCCDARNDTVIQKLRLKKDRPQKPFALMYPSMALLKSHFEISETQEAALSSSERPIVIVKTLSPERCGISSAIAPSLNQLGIMLPNSGILQLVANEIDFPIVATSGNRSGYPVQSNTSDAFEMLNPIADYFLQHNLKITHPQDDSVLKFSEKFASPVLFRRSRGYAPNYPNFRISNTSTVMAMGAQLKSTIAFLPNDYLYVSQYIGHLDNYGVYKRFVETASDFRTIFQEEPRIILVDKHPAYHSTLYGVELSEKYTAELHKIQHHKAHLASVLAEHQLFETSDPVLGVIWDGTGYGDDHQIWGGEFFMYYDYQIQRIAHFEYFNWVANDKMAEEPRLSLLSLLENDENQILSKKFTEKELSIYRTLKRRNSLKTSSVGRLFDAVAALLDVCDANTYEGEAAIKLENLVTDYNLKVCNAYTFDLIDGCIPTKAIIQEIRDDFVAGIDRSVIARNFLFTMASSVLQVAKHHNMSKIACSGGVFQNTILIDMLKELAGDALDLFFNCNLSPNDENISVGQMMYYLYGIDNR
jgi:hydrogenase maturation protein HypF